MEGDQHIHVTAGEQEPGHPDHLVGANRSRPHAVGDLNRETYSGAGGCQVSLQNRLTRSHRVDHGAAGDVLDPGKGALQGHLCRPIHQRETLGFNHLASRQGSCRSHIFLGGLGGDHARPAINPAGEKKGERSGKQQRKQKGDKQSAGVHRIGPAGEGIESWGYPLLQNPDCAVTSNSATAQPSPLRAIPCRLTRSRRMARSGGKF